MSKKPKPATVGEKMVLWFWGDMMNLADVRNPHTPCEENARAFARRIDAALRRERLKERRRCSWIGGEIDDAKMLEMVRSGEAL